MRPFSTLLVAPYLWATPEQARELQRRFYELSRELHPDRFANADDETRAEVESRSALLNADYARLKDFWRLVETVAAAEAAPARASTPPPELAADYFELQEQAMELGPAHAEVRKQAEALKATLRARLLADETKVEDFAKRFPYAGPATTDIAAPWNEKDLEELRKLLQAVRFGRSFLRDLEAKFPA
jgi:molecular chaperone HscB